MEKQSAQLITLYGFREADKWGVTEVCLDPTLEATIDARERVALLEAAAHRLKHKASYERGELEKKLGPRHA